MGAIKSKNKKYVILYGPPECGKTFMLYNSQARFNNVLGKMEPTEGFNYEEIQVSRDLTPIGVFDISGDLMQYDVVNIVCKSVDITGLIFIVPADKFDMYDFYQQHLKLILNNKNLNLDSLNVMIIFNLKNELKEKLGWININVLINKLGLKKIFNSNPVNSQKSYILDVNNVLSGDNDFVDSLKEYLKSFNGM